MTICRKRTFVSLYLIFIGLLLLGCRYKTNDEPTDTLYEGIISIAVDENMYNIVNSELDVFAHHFPQAFVFPVFKTEKEVLLDLINDSVKLAIVGRDLDAYEYSLLPATRVVRKYPFGYEGIAFVINKDNKDSVMNTSQIEGILKGDISVWQDVNPDSSLDTIKVFFQSRSNGVMRYVADSITKGTRDVKRQFYVLSEGENMVDKIASNPNNIGIVGMNQLGNLNSQQYISNMQKVTILRVSQNDKPTVENSFLPYAGDIYNGNYPYWRPLSVLIAESREGLARGFCFFLTQQIGQKVVLKAGLMPIIDANKRMTRWSD